MTLAGSSPGRGERSLFPLSCGRICCIFALLFHLLLLFFSLTCTEARAPLRVSLDVSARGGLGKLPGLAPRRLLVGWTLRKFFFVKTPETLLAERARSLRAMAPGCDYGLQFLYSAVMVAGKHTPHRSSLIDTSMEDIMVAFFRLANLEKTRFPLQWYAIETALRRSHARAIQMALRRQQADQQDYENDPDREKPLDLTVPEYTWMLGQQTRDAEWFFDGNTFHKRGEFTIPDKLTDHDIGFFKSLPYNIVRVARGIERETPTKSVAHLIEELRQRGVRTAHDFFAKTNFLDLLFSTSVIDETLIQIDILSEYISNWQAFKANELKPPSIPLGNGLPDLLQTLTSKKTTKEKYPKCPTMKCYLESVWHQRSEHPIDKEDNKQKDGNEEKKKEPSSEPFAELLIKKTTANSLKVVAIGNTGQAKYEKSKGVMGRIKSALKLNELEETVNAMKIWHEKEGVDVALGLGDFLQPPGILSVREPGFKEKWHDIFVKEAGLDIPWYMVNGEAESTISSSAPYRYHYTRQDANFHNPNWLYKSVITMVANLTTATGGTEDQEFTVHVISIDTWALFGGTPFYDNLGQYQNNMIALSNALYHSAKAKADWIIVQGHHPLTSTGPEAEEARLTYIDDMVKSSRPRGPEHRLVDLLTSYQVDAYISGHDNVLEYVSMADLDKNSTLAFITSGGGTRIMSGILGRGWLGRLRGRLFPLLCWSGKRIFYKLDPGGCKPSEKDQALAYKFYAPQGPNWKITVKERILNTTGFASMKFTKDFLIVDFVSSGSGKPTGRRLHKQTNKAARAVKFADFWEEADLKLKELNIDHEAFEEENRERVASEIAFQTRTPILAERLRLFERELMDMYNEYQHLKSKKAMYETMNAQKAAALEAQGENLRESELSEGMYEQTERIIELMYVIASHHGYMWERYEDLKAQRKKLPPHDGKHAEALLKLEKKLVEVMRQRRELNKKYVDQGNHPTVADMEQIKDYAIKSRILKRDIKEFEQVMKEEEKAEGGEEKEGEEKKDGDPSKTDTQKDAEEPEIKPLDQSIEARLGRKQLQLKEHERVMANINALPATEKEKLKEDIGMLERQHERLRAEVDRLNGILNRKYWAADRRPSELWEKRLQKHDLEQTLAQLEAYKDSILMLPKVQRRTKDLNDAVASIDLQKIDIEEQLLELSDELYNTTATVLQEQFIQQLDKLREVSLLVDSRNTMPPEALQDPEIQKSLDEAKEALELLQQEVDAADEALRKELNDQDESWIRRMIIRGVDMRQLAEEFSIDVDTVIQEDIKERKDNPYKQLAWVQEQIAIFNDRLHNILSLPQERQEKLTADKEKTETRLAELRKLEEEAQKAIELRETAANAAAAAAATTTTTTTAEGEKDTIGENTVIGDKKDKEIQEREEEEEEEDNNTTTTTPSPVSPSSSQDNSQEQQQEQQQQKQQQEQEQEEEEEIVPMIDDDESVLSTAATGESSSSSAAAKETGTTTPTTTTETETPAAAAAAAAAAARAAAGELSSSSVGGEIDEDDEDLKFEDLRFSSSSSAGEEGQETRRLSATTPPPPPPPSSSSSSSSSSSFSSSSSPPREKGQERRRLAAIMDWFQPKKEESPVKELPSIDLGPKDPCEGEPMLYIIVKKIINAEYNATFTERCKKIFANRIHRQQRRFLGLFDDSGSPSFYELPHPFIIKSFNSLFNTFNYNSFIHLLIHIKYKLINIHQFIHVANYDDIQQQEQQHTPEQKEEEEFILNDDE